LGLADHDRAGGLDPLDHDVVLVGHEVGVGVRPRRRADALGADEVLDPGGHADQWSDLASGGEVGLDPLGVLPGLVRHHCGEHVERRVELVQPFQDRLGHLHRRQFLRRDGTGQGGRVHLADLVARRHRLRLLAVLPGSDRTGHGPTTSQTPVGGLDRGTMGTGTTYRLEPGLDPSAW
jgi:hypothetical protein